MKKINRRKWLQLTGLGGLATTISPLESFANTSTRENTKKNLIAKLNANENPFGPSQKVRQAMMDAFDMGCRYPYWENKGLAKIIAKREGVTDDHIVMTAGSMEGLRAAGLTYGINGGEIITADPVYQSLIKYAEQLGAFINRVPLTKDMGHDLEEMEKRITNRTSLVFICNPNNPTGSLIPQQELKDFCNKVSQKTVVFSDEAYYDYITEPDYPSMINLVKKGKNVIVSKTLSKVYALAGLRIGYLITRPDIAARIRKNVMAQPNMMAVIAAKAAFEDQAFYKFSLEKNKEAKQYIYKTLDELGLRYIPSHTNFVFFHTGRDIKELGSQMKVKGVAIGRAFPPLNDWCRISTGKIEDVKNKPLSILMDT